MTQPKALYLLRLILAMIHICTKFELSGFRRSVDRRLPNFQRGSRDPSHDPYGGLLYFVS